MNTRILITGAGGAAAMALMKAVGHLDLDIFAADMDPLAAGLYLVPPSRRVIIPAGRSAEFASTMLEICDSLAIELLLPTVDVEMVPLALWRADFEERGVTLMAADAEAIATCLDKAALMEAAQDVIPVPRWGILNTRFDAREFSWPAIVKPRAGAGGRGVVKVDSPDDLSSIPWDGSMLVQELLPGVEYSVDVLATPDGVPLAAVPRDRLKVDSGVAVVARSVRDPELVDLARRLVAKLGLGWVSNVQLKRDARGVPRLLEINPRFPGTMSLTVKAGVNMPAASVAMALGRDPQVSESFDEVLMVRQWSESFQPVSELDGMFAQAERARPSTGRKVA